MEITGVLVFRAIRFCNSLSRRGGGTKANCTQNRAQKVLEGNYIASRFGQTVLELDY